MQNCCLYVLLLLACLSSIESRRKRKFEGDFEFDEGEARWNKKEVTKTWILDPENELCQALRCRRREMCLLEDEFTAVCVSKREIRKNGDRIISKSSSSSSVSSGEKMKDKNDDSLSIEDEDEVNNCEPCPVVKPTFICGTDNSTYSSLCRMDYHNCLHDTDVKILCKGFCPCKESQKRATKKQLQKQNRMNKFMKKYKSTVWNEKSDKYYKHSKEGKSSKPHSWKGKDRQRQHNEVIKPKVYSNSNYKNKNCPIEALKAMGNRLLDWFSVIKAEHEKDKKSKHQHYYYKPHFPPTCKGEVEWMFKHLDEDNDAQLTLKELYELEQDDYEKCIKPFLDQCDVNRDTYVSAREWCQCFDNSERPCAAARRRVKPGLIGAYSPDCDKEGYFSGMQCHGSIGLCWCVDKHGVEYANTRTHGQPNCEILVKKLRETDDEDEVAEDIEGSADNTLEI